MTFENEIIPNEELMDAKEYLKQKRKEAYEAAKMQAKQERLAIKEQNAQIKKEEKAKKRALLWESMKKGSNT